jgi:hypothetical protein
LESFFPDSHNGYGNANILSELKRESLNILKKIKLQHEGNNEEAEKLQKTIDNIQNYINSINPPRDFSNTSNNVIKNIDKSFEKVCTSLEELGINNPKGLTLFEFKSKIEYFKNKNKPKNEY